MAKKVIARPDSFADYDAEEEEVRPAGRRHLPMNEANNLMDDKPLPQTSYVNRQELLQQIEQLQEQLMAQSNGLMVQDGELVVQGFQFLPTGLIAPEDFSEALWEQVGQLLFRLEGSIQWLIGDWLAYGANLRYGDIRKLADALERDENTLSNYKMVCQGIEFPRRRGNLSFGHHEVVYVFSPDEQEYYLHYAAHGEEKPLSVSRFRAWVKEQRREVSHALPAYASTPVPKPALSGLEKLAQRDPSTYKQKDRTAILKYAAQVQAWLDELVERARS